MRKILIMLLLINPILLNCTTIDFKINTSLRSDNKVLKSILKTLDIDVTTDITVVKLHNNFSQGRFYIKFNNHTVCFSFNQSLVQKIDLKESYIDSNLIKDLVMSNFKNLPSKYFLECDDCFSVKIIKLKKTIFGYKKIEDYYLTNNGYRGW